MLLIIIIHYNLRFSRAFERGLITLWKRHDYLASLHRAKFTYKKIDLVQDLKLEDEIIAFGFLLLFTSISSIVLFIELAIYFISKNPVENTTTTLRNSNICIEKLASLKRHQI